MDESLQVHFHPQIQEEDSKESSVSPEDAELTRSREDSKESSSSPEDELSIELTRLLLSVYIAIAMGQMNHYICITRLRPQQEVNV